MTPFDGPSRARYLGWIFCALAVVFPLWKLLPLHATFAVDWHNHQWMAAYSGEYLRQHAAFPVVINTNEQAGMPYPIFYGVHFFPALATLTTWMNPGIVIRLMALLVTWLQFRLISRALASPGVPTWVPRGVACLMIWATYPLTNLYNRSALTEFFATSLLTCAVATWFLLLRATEPTDRRRLALGVGLLFAMTTGTHPITALYSLPMFGLLFAAAYQEYGRDLALWKALARAVAIPMGLVLVVLTPWIYALRHFQKFVTISTDLQAVWFDLAAIDRLSTRFFPIPYDSRTNDLPIARVSTPFLDAQLSVPMLILLSGWLLIIVWRKRSGAIESLRSAALGLCAFVFFVWISLSPRAFDFLPSIATMIQIAYRAITYQNLALLLATLSLFALLRRRRDTSLFAGRPIATALMACCLVLAGVGVVVQWSHAAQIMRLDGPSGLLRQASQRRGLIALPRQFYGSAAYATPSLYRGLGSDEKATAKRVAIPVGSGSDFGFPRPLDVSMPSAGWIVTNVQAFPWNRIDRDGTAVPDDQLRIYGIWFAVFAAAGEHTITLRTEADSLWVVLRAISFATLACWLGCVLFLSIKASRGEAARPARGRGGSRARRRGR